MCVLGGEMCTKVGICTVGICVMGGMCTGDICMRGGDDVYGRSM